MITVAEKRMFAKSIVLSDAFLDMPMSARCLYFTLSMCADDDGFVGSPKAIMRQCGASQDDIALLLQKRYVLGFESGVIVIKHWRINNYLQNDRHKNTTYVEELKMLSFDAKGAYVERAEEPCIQNVYNLDTKCIHSIDKNSIEEYSVLEREINKEKETVADTATETPQTKPERHKYGEYQNVLLSDAEMDKLKQEFPGDYLSRIERLSAYIASTGKRYQNHLATIRNWARMEKERGKVVAPNPKNRSFSDADIEAYEEWGRKQLKAQA